MTKTASVFCRLYRESFWIRLVGLLLFVGLAGFAEGADGIVVNYFGGGAAVANRPAKGV